MLIEGETGQVLSYAGLVYLLPVVLFFVGYGAGSALQKGAGISALCGGILFAAGIVGAILFSHQMKRKNSVPFEITKKL